MFTVTRSLFTSLHTSVPYYYLHHYYSSTMHTHLGFRIRYHTRKKKTSTGERHSQQAGVLYRMYPYHTSQGEGR